MAHVVFIRGIPQQPTVNVREQPTTASTLLFTVPVDGQGTCSEVKLDARGSSFQGQVFRWLFLTFGDGRKGWVRDDLLDLQGDCSAFGYGVLAARTFAFTAAFTAPTGTVTIAEVTPIVVVTPVAEVTPVTPPAPVVAVPSPPTGCDAAVRRDIQARVRSGPSVASNPVALLDPSTAVRVLGVEPGQDGQSFRWVRVRVNGVDGFIREDLLTFSADCAGFGLPVTAVATGVAVGSPTTVRDKFPTPVKGPYRVTQEFGHNRHKGTDLGGAVGLPIVAGGNGVVAFTMTCTRCRPNAPNFPSQGLPISDQVAINDPAWGFGFGNHVVVRYAYADLPTAMQTALTNQSLGGSFAYVVHAHLSRIDIASGAAVTAGTPLGLLGNTGNSSGAHLHLEVRLSFEGDLKTIFNRVVTEPRDMYQL